MLEITYLHHSGFAAEFDDCLLLFDVISELPEELQKSAKPKLFLISHVHHDHFSEAIFDYRGDQVRYILSDDIGVSRADDISFVAPNERMVIPFAGSEILIQTFGSTDRGVSFLVQHQKKTLFYAGDLNWWAWDTSLRPHIDPLVEERDYKNILAQLKRRLTSRIDVAFVPCDPRLGDEGELKSCLYFMEQFEPVYLFPMHFWGDFDIIKRLQSENRSRTIIETIEHTDQKFSLKHF